MDVLIIFLWYRETQFFLNVNERQSIEFPNLLLLVRVLEIDLIIKNLDFLYS